MDSIQTASEAINVNPHPINDTPKFSREDYLESLQLTQLIGDIEKCANRLAEAAKVAKSRYEKLHQLKTGSEI